MTEPSGGAAPTIGPAEEHGPPPPPSRTGAVRIQGGVIIAAAIVIVIFVCAVVATPFWAPAVMRAMPWGAQANHAASPQPSAAEMAAAAARAQASKNEGTLLALGQRVAALEAKPTPPPPPDLSAIQQQIGGLDKSVSDLSQSVVALKKAQAQPSADLKSAALALVLLQIREAIDIGRPFDAEYRVLVALAHDHPEIVSAAQPLAGPAQSGVATRAALAERLRQLAPEIATAKTPPKDTLKSQIVARLRSLVTIRRIEGSEQTPAEAAVGTAQRDVASGDLNGAVTALSGLAGPSQTAVQPWLQMAKARLTAEDTLRQTEAALTAALGAAGLTQPGKNG